jgi:hypothetical protein
MINLSGAFLAPACFLVIPALGPYSGLQVLLTCISMITNPPSGAFADVAVEVAVVGLILSIWIGLITVLNLILCLVLASGQRPDGLRSFQLFAVTLAFLTLLVVFIIVLVYLGSSATVGKGYPVGILLLLFCFGASFANPRPPPPTWP